MGVVSIKFINVACCIYTIYSRYRYIFNTIILGLRHILHQSRELIAHLLNYRLWKSLPRNVGTS